MFAFAGVAMQGVFIANQMRSKSGKPDDFDIADLLGYPLVRGKAAKTGACAWASKQREKQCVGPAAVQHKSTHWGYPAVHWQENKGAILAAVPAHGGYLPHSTPKCARALFMLC